MSVMFANKEVATRHLPIAHGRDVKAEKAESARRDRRPESRRISETRLQAAVVRRDRERDDIDPYADVPCTD